MGHQYRPYENPYSSLSMAPYTAPSANPYTTPESIRNYYRAQPPVSMYSSPMVHYNSTPSPPTFQPDTKSMYADKLDLFDEKLLLEKALQKKQQLEANVAENKRLHRDLAELQSYRPASPLYGHR